MYAQVVVDIQNDAVDRVFDYLALNNTKIGMRVLVPFAGRTVLGYVLGLSESSNFDASKIKPIKQHLDEEPKIKPEILELCKFMSKHFFLRLSDCIRLALPSCVRLDSERAQLNYTCTLIFDIETAINMIGKRAKSQLSVVAFLSEQGEANYLKLVELFGRSSVNAVIEKGIVSKTAIRIMRKPEIEQTHAERHILTKAQDNAVKQICNNNSTFLLHGVTGSGKTEIYMSVIEKALSENKTAIMLVPEISLTPQMMNRFNSRFPGMVAVLHSGLSEGERFDEWERIFSGEAQ